MKISEQDIKYIYDILTNIGNANLQPVYKLNHFFTWILNDVQLSGRTICDIGVGKGSSNNSFDIANKLIKSIGRKNISLMNQDFMKNEIPDKSIDYIFAINSIHHVIELTNEKTNLNGMVDRLNIVFLEFDRILKDNGKIIIWDSSRNCIWRFLPGKRMSNIDWYLHPNLSEWKEALKLAGLDYQIDYTVPLRLQKFNPFINNYLCNFLLSATFKISIQKN